MTRAAEALHISQPALTAQIKALEDEFQVALFERTPSGMVITKAGHQLLARAEEVLQSVQKLKNEGKALHGEIAGKAAIGTLSSPGFIRLGEFLNIMVERYPLVELELHHQISGLAAEHVGDRTLDASFYYGEIGNPGVTGIHLRDMVYCVAAPSAWKEKVEDKEWREIAALPWILAPSISTHNQLLRGLFEEQGVEPTKVVEADHESVINSLIVAEVGLSLMVEEQALLAQEAGEIVVWDDVRLHTHLWFIYLAERAHDPVITALVEVMRDTWQIGPGDGGSGKGTAAAVKPAGPAGGRMPPKGKKRKAAPAPVGAASRFLETKIAGR